MLGEEAFPDRLATYSTTYNASNYNRSTNLRLSASKINGVILMPGEEFSYNKTLGQRTAAAGYKPAGAYVGGKVVNEYGGGICQTSSTLYNTVLLANLEVTSRTNHCYVSSYVPISRDATVSWGTLDFKFKNNRKNPAFIGPSTVMFSCPTNTPTSRTLVTVPRENFPILSLPNQNPAKSVRKIASSGCTLS